MDFAEQLLAELVASPSWPLGRECHAQMTVGRRRAFRFRDKPRLKEAAAWHRHTVNGVERDYVADPLPRLIEKAYADFLYGTDPEFSTEDTAAEELLAQLVAENRMPAKLHRAERLVVGEGEGWWKWHVNRDVAPVAMLEWWSRLGVVPLFYGDRVLAAAFVSEVAAEDRPDDGEDLVRVVWRHVEIHADGRVLNLLFEGRHDALGNQREIGRRPETAGMMEVWEHGLPMLAGRIVNELDDDPGLGASDFDQVDDLLLALNEAMTIATENARLTGKDRIFASGRFMQADGTFDASLEVFQVEPDGATLGEGDSKPPIVAIEKSYDADPLWTHVRGLVHTILSRVGIVPRFVGADETDGGAESGVAIRLKFLPTTNAASGKAREWVGLPKILDLGLRAGALSVEQGGLGQAYSATSLPSVERGEPLPADEGETVKDNATAVLADIRSRKTAVREQHPNWTDEQVDEELAEIRAQTEPPLPPPPGA